MKRALAAALAVVGFLFLSHVCVGRTVKTVAGDVDDIWRSAYSYIWSHPETYEIVRKDVDMHLLHFKIFKEGTKKVEEPKAILEVTKVSASDKNKGKDTEKTSAPRVRITVTMSSLPSSRELYVIEKILHKHHLDTAGP